MNKQTINRKKIQISHIVSYKMKYPTNINTDNKHYVATIFITVHKITNNRR